MRTWRQSVRFFALWSVAFYATGLAYAFEGRRELMPAALSLLLVAVALASCVQTVLQPSKASSH
jgi:hypothetical protein